MTTATDYSHDRTVAAFFDSRTAADKALADVVASGVPSNMVSVTEGRGGETSSTAATQTHEGGFWGLVKNLFAPEEDKHAYAEGLSRGGYLLTAHTSNDHYDRVLEIMDSEGAVDMDQRETQWKSEGWSGHHDQAPAAGTSSAAARRLETPVATRTETSKAATLGTAVPAGDLTSRQGSITDDRGADSAVGPRGADGTGDETIQLAEESLRVGKRDVNHGRVRLRSYVVEKPVHESVNLHSEQVNVSRKPVDRALGAGENLFQERTLSAEEHSEEAVVSKEAHVYEEVSLGKTVQDRSQAINDTVRRTEVEVDDGRTGGVERTAALADGVTGGSMASKIAEHMEVRDSSNTKVGSVDHYDGGETIKLAKHDAPDGVHHLIPTSWIARVDEHVHLAKSGADVRSGWTAA